MEAKLMQQTRSWYKHTKGKVIQVLVLLKNSIANIQEDNQLITETMYLDTYYEEYHLLGYNAV
jgi:hypothetical protein